MAGAGMSTRVLRGTMIRGSAKRHPLTKLTDGPKTIVSQTWNSTDSTQIVEIVQQRQIHHHSTSTSFLRKGEHHCHHNFHSCPARSIADRKQWHGPSASTSLLQSSSHSSALENVRCYVSSQKNDPSTQPSIDPYSLVSAELSSLTDNIQKSIITQEPQLKTMSHYYFNGKGKAFRPLVVLLMSKACNVHNGLGSSISNTQKIVAFVTEMIHTASLVHDDVVDASDTRRGMYSLNKMYGERLSILAGDFILSQASIALAKTGSSQVIRCQSIILEDIVAGEFMQLGSKEDEKERFAHYLKKTYKKTASLIANSCKSAAILSHVNDDVQELAFEYGRNLGMAFQLIDDLLDFTSSEKVMGKPTAADLRLGLATAPVLFAAQQYPELHPMIMRRFSEEGDVETARDLVAKSNGVEQTKLMAAQHSKEAVKIMQSLTVSDAQLALMRMANILLERKR